MHESLNTHTRMQVKGGDVIFILTFTNNCVQCSSSAGFRKTLLFPRGVGEIGESEHEKNRQRGQREEEMSRSKSVQDTN